MELHLHRPPGRYKTMRLLKILAIAIIACTEHHASVHAQETAHIQSIVKLLGAEDAESLDEQELERMVHLMEHPLDINNAPRSKLIASGLFSRYQIASLDDYRSIHGDILSAAELATLEGFGEERALLLAPFITFKSHSLPGQVAKDTAKLGQTFLTRTAMRTDNGAESPSPFKERINYGLKYKAEYGDALEVSASTRSTYGSKQFPPSSWSANICLHGRRKAWNAIIGDFNARFGQGLALWSGMSMTGFSSASSFCRHPSGISPSWSYSGTGSHRGVAADMAFGRFVASGFLSLPGLRSLCEGSSKASVSMMPGVNLSWYGRNGQLGFTSAWTSPKAPSGTKNPWSGNMSLDGRWSWKGVEAFGEVALATSGGAAVSASIVNSSSLAGVLGAIVPVWEDIRLSLVGRYYPASYSPDYASGVRTWTKTSDERGFAIGLERHSAMLSADFAQKDSEPVTRQCKLMMKVPLQLSRTMVASLRATERIRPYEPVLKYRTSVRCDLDWSSAGLSARYGESEGDAWKARFRVEGLLYRSVSGLTYFEAGRKTSHWSSYLRGTIFIVDNWDDRIYSYERDAPGNYTVPAYYGRGYSLAAVGGAKFRCGRFSASGNPAYRKRYVKTYLRLSTTQYPWMEAPKPGRTELKFQATIDL